jgi:hypothetical protein
LQAFLGIHILIHNICIDLVYKRTFFGDMALYSLLQEAFTAPSSARDIGQEMLHAALLLSCAFVGWCSSSVLVRACGWFQNCQDEGKAKNGSRIFCDEVAAFVQASNVTAAAQHFGFSCTDIQNCIDAAEKRQSWWNIALWQPRHADAVVAMTTQLSASGVLHSAEAPPKECEDDCNFSVAPTVKPGMLLLEQYGVFGARSGTWSVPVDGELENNVPPEKVDDAFACSHGYGMLSNQSTTGSQQYSYDTQGRVWVPLEYTW